MKALYYLISIAFALIPVFIVAGLAYRLRYYKKRKSISPLTTNLFRMPGHSVRKEIDKVYDKFDENLTFFLVTSVAVGIIISFHLAYESSEITYNHIIAVAVVISLFFIPYVIFFAYKFLNHVKRLQKLKRGLECEIAVGQALTELLRDGYYVYHDLPADNFNIDHVVIGAVGIFMIETKGRSKPKNHKGTPKIKYDGKKLYFPHWEENAPVEQAKNQAIWLKKEIKQHTNIDVNVNPVIVFPGWYVPATAHVPRVLNDSYLVNGLRKWAKNFEFSRLNEAQIQSIRMYLENRCRDIKPYNYELPEN